MLGQEMNAGLDGGPIQKMCGAGSVQGPNFGKNFISLASRCENLFDFMQVFIRRNNASREVIFQKYVDRYRPRPRPKIFSRPISDRSFSGPRLSEIWPIRYFADMQLTYGDIHIGESLFTLEGSF